MDDLRADIDGFVAGLLSGYELVIPSASKVVHDPIWGTNEFQPHELAIIDSPVIQRLRRIYQVGYSYLTFPSSTQTRFEHSLGAAVVGTRMLKAIKQRHPDHSDLVDMDPLKGDVATIRAACLLHDCGHGFGSHASEEIYKWHPALLQARQSEAKFIDAKASEILSWYIVTSPAFQALLGEINSKCGTALDAERIADLILGIPWDHRSFLGEVLNGPFDVDRVDYIVRDTEYSGVKAAIDLERFFHDVDVSLLQGKLHLVLRSTHAIEQLLWTKVHLFSRLYRHQKTLAADAAVQSIVPIVKATGPFHGVQFKNVSDFLHITDMDILGADIAHLPPRLATLLTNIRYRRLPQRALAITLAALKSAGTPAQRMLKLIALNETEDGIATLQREIHEAIPEHNRPPLESILVVFPKPPPLREASQTYVVLRGREPTTLNELFRIDEWLTTYNEQHWAGYLFCNRENVDAVCKAALEVLTKRDIELDPVQATAARKPPAPCPAPVPRQIASEESFFEVAVKLPVLEAFTQGRFAAGAQNAFADLRAVFILHFLTDLSPFLERFEKLGLNPKNAWLIRKPYAYPSAAAVAQKLRARGYTIHDCTAAEGTEGPARRALLELKDKFSGGDRFMVVEDGGYITPMLHTEEFAGLRERCIGVVEQTTKGIESIRAVDNSAGLKLPVISVAESPLKRLMEASEVGDALAVTLENYFRRFRTVPMHRLPVLIVGFGAVGRNLAVALAMRGAKVTIFDLEPERQYDAASYKVVGGFEVLESLDDLAPFRLIVGTTGKTSLDINTLLKCADGAILASGSSDRLEFDVGKLREHVVQPIDQNIVVEKWSTIYRLTNGRSIEVLCDGYPINFILGDGIAKSVIDPILAELLAGALLLAQKQVTAPGIHKLPKELEKELWELYRKLRGL